MWCGDGTHMNGQHASVPCANGTDGVGRGNWHGQYRDCQKLSVVGLADTSLCVYDYQIFRPRTARTTGQPFALSRLSQRNT